MAQPGRGLGVPDALGGLFDEVGVVVLAALTQLGDVWFMSVLAGGLYLASTRPGNPLARRRGAFVLALPIVYVVTVQALKGVFALPRPPDAGVAATISWLPSLLTPVFENAATAEGYGFPSGHALGTTLVWGGVALATDYRTWRFRLGVAGAAVVAVSFSRLALGVHYLVDVIAGVAIGAVLLLALYWFADRGTDPGRALLVAVAIGLVGVLNGISFDSVAAFGVAAGAWFAWYALVDRAPATPRTSAMAAVSVVTLALAGVLFLALYVSVPPTPVTAMGSAVAAAAIVAAPDLGERVVSAVDSERDHTRTG
ncbi:phosphatase PAP2 family protein [Halococcus sp. PRR34]|uniref:phosphatase PAP2 family protein n=1 Tax=Halococcus sp. PRR34 TaxID=3020830 RepID=UPI0023611D76|nr:phosphatase PAP2 family protein [Halococcus sp. PRR34]